MNFINSASLPTRNKNVRVLQLILVNRLFRRKVLIANNTMYVLLTVNNLTFQGAPQEGNESTNGITQDAINSNAGRKNYTCKLHDKISFT